MLEYAVAFTFGSIIYGLIEIMVRGFTHWSMLICGGICLTVLYFINAYSSDRIWKKCIMGMFIITTVEFLAGIIVNLKLGLGIWDYSGYMLNLLGQICPRFSFYWLILSIPGFAACRVLRSLFSATTARSQKQH